ncbi:MAG: glycosyltransferase family 2 protein, partial [Candidatus Levyibacteriota bacterium]
QHLKEREAFGVDVVFGKIRNVKKIKRTQTGFIFEKIVPSWPERSLFCGFFKRRVFEHVGLFDQSFLLNEDTDWFLRAREKGIRFSLLDQETYLRRIHTNNRTKNRIEANNFLLKAIKKSLARREKTGTGFASPLSDLSKFLY